MFDINKKQGLVILIFITLLFPSLLLASGSAEPKGGSIRVLLVTPAPLGCIGQQTLDLDAVLTNITEQDVELSQDGLAHSVSFRKIIEGKITNETGFLLDGEPGHWIRIAAHGSVVVRFSEPISSKMFASPGIFSVQIDFGLMLKYPEQYSRFPGSVSSNEGLFLLSSCEANH